MDQQQNHNLGPAGHDESLDPAQGQTKLPKGAQIVRLRLDGADLELLRAGEAQGYATGAREATATLRKALADWEAQAIKQAADEEQEKQLKEFVSWFYTILNMIDQQALSKESERHQSIGRAIELGAGQPRERKLRARARSAIVGLVEGWRK